MIRLLESKSSKAWPALEEVGLDGWVLRFADGYTRRANSVIPLERGALALEPKVQGCERFYKERGLPTVFKMTEASEPPGLDNLLERRGYALEADTSVQSADLSHFPLPNAPDPALIADASISDAWLDTFIAMAETEPRRTQLIRRMLGSLASPARFARLTDAHDSPVACGLAVLDGEHVGLFDIVTAVDQRRRGFARRLVQSLLDWGRSQGASQAYLQVMVDNGPAMELYRGFGFIERYQYWYRVKRN